MVNMRAGFNHKFCTNAPAYYLSRASLTKEKGFKTLWSARHVCCCHRLLHDRKVHQGGIK